MVNIVSYKWLSIVLIALFIMEFAIAPPVYNVKAQNQAPNGPYLDKILFIHVSDPDKALKMIESGDMQLWLWPLSTKESIDYAEKSPKIGLVSAWSGCYDLFINPLDTRKTAGQFNPFSIRTVREAFNRYVDRKFIVDTIMGGFGVPQWTVIPPKFPDYVRNYVAMKTIEKEYSYNPDVARDTIFNALYNAGAQYVNGKWYYNGKPITVKIVIRIEDARKQIGEYIADLLEKLGFTVDRIYSPAAKAIPLVYGGDPRKYEWTIYTEGWAYLAIPAYDDEDAYYMYTSPWTGTVFDYYRPSPILQDLATKLLKAEYKDLVQRSEWLIKVNKLGVEDSVRIWLVWQETPFPKSSNLVNVSYDLIGGAWSFFTLRTARYANKIGGEAKVGNRVMFTSAYNPVGGLSWLYDVLIAQNVYDVGVYSHPHTGEYIPVRANFTVVTKGPSGKLTVPSDAITFNPKTMTWSKVGTGVTSASAVTFTYVLGKWQDGSDITMTDILYSIAHALRLCNPSDPIYDPDAITPGLELFNATFRGVKVLGPNKLVVYLDYWHPDKTFIAYRADVWPILPWEVDVIMDDAVAHKKLAWTDARAEEWGVPWLDLTKGRSLPILESIFKNMSSVNYIPTEIKQWVTASDAKARWSALGDFYSKYNNFFDSNGPFIISKVDTVGKMVELTAFRQYPFKANHWDFLVTPKVPSVAITAKPSQVIPGLAASINVTVTLKGTPYSKVELKALLVNAKGVTVMEIAPTEIAPGRFAFKLSSEDTAKLVPGIYSFIVVAVGEEAALPIVKTTQLVVIPSTEYMSKKLEEFSRSIASRLNATSATLSKALADMSAAFSADIGNTKASLTTTIKNTGSSIISSISDLHSSIDSLNSAIKGLSQSLSMIYGILIATIIIVIIDIIVTIWIGRRK